MSRPVAHSISRKGACYFMCFFAVGSDSLTAAYVFYSEVCWVLHRCTDKTALRLLKRIFPVVDWISRYPVREWLLSDVISGVSTGLVCSLQGEYYRLLTDE